MQHVECETCGTIFLNVNAWLYTRVSRCYNNRMKQPSIPDWRRFDVHQPQQYVNGAKQTLQDVKGQYDKFFCQAVLHWCDNPTHTIIVSVPLGNNGPVQRFDMTRDFKQALATFGPDFIVGERGLMLAAYDEGSII